MSRYQLNKFITWVEGLDAEVEAYSSDPAAYVDAWESVDHGELYRLGAHPYMLWHFVEAVRVWAGDATWPEMKERYRADVIPHGYPDITT